MTQLSTSTDRCPEAWIERLFEKMAALYGNRFLDMWGKTDLQAVKSLWSQELGKLSREEIARGANALMTLEWPPTLPQFLKISRIDIDPLTAYYEAVNGAVAREQGLMGEYSHPAIFWAATKIGAFDLKHQSYSAIKGRWETALAQEMAKGEWNDIPAPMIALPPAAPASKEVAEKFLAQTQVYKVEDSKVDHKAWAKKILQRIKDGDKTITPLQKSFAVEALQSELS
jgi:hypothetical protein